MSNDEENAKPKYRPSYFRWNFDDFLAEADHLGPIAMNAAIRLMRAMWRSDDCALPDDAKLLNRIIRGGSGVRARWGEQLQRQLAGVINVNGGRVSSPWLTRKWLETGAILARKWHSATDKPLKEKGPTSPNREFRIQNSESKATTAAKARSMAKEKEASKGEQVETPLTPEEKAERLVKYDEFKAAQKRAAVKQVQGFTEGEIEKMVEVFDEQNVCADQTGTEDDVCGSAA
jgi:hypothetical protein